MKRTCSILLSIAVGAVAAGSAGRVSAGEQTGKSADASTAEQANRYPTDDTGRNVRDRNGGMRADGAPSNAEADRKLSQKIRRAVVEDDSLSATAHNVKIISQNGVVTLRGPVTSTRERRAIVAKATEIAGAGKVENQLELAPKKSQQ